MKKFLLFLFILCQALVSFAQGGQVILNNNVYMVMDGGVFIVVDNPNANAVSTVGTGGNLVSEDEDNKLRWMIGTSTGTYVVPYTSNPATTNIKIPQTMIISAAGVGVGHIDFSCYEAATDMNAPWPSMVTHMNDAATGSVDHSLYVMDRWWMIDAQNYATKPTVTMQFTYIDAANEMGGTNAIAEGSLVAQRFNDGNGTWGVPSGGAYPAWGTANTVNNTVSGITPPPNEFFAAWILVDNFYLLNVDLVEFDAHCKGGEVVIDWATASETNNAYFTIERSIDRTNWEVLAEIQGEIGSTSFMEYQWIDPAPLSSIAYYRLKQTDLNGTESEYFDEVEVNACTENGGVLVFNNGNGTISLGIHSNEHDMLSIQIFDMSGRLVYAADHEVENGYQSLSLQHDVFAQGLYNLRIDGKYTTYNKKVLLK